MEKKPLTHPQNSVVRHSIQSMGKKHSRTNQTIPINPANIPRDLRFRANSLKIKSFSALHIRQHNA